MSNTVIQLRDKELVLQNGSLESTDLSQLLTVHYDNIAVEVAEFPYILNQINLLQIETADLLRQAEFDLEICKSNLEEYKAKNSFAVITELKEIDLIKSPTADNINSKIIVKKDYIDMAEGVKLQKQKIMNLITNKENMTSLYWAAKSKMDILTSLTKGLSLEGILNNGDSKE